MGNDSSRLCCRESAALPANLASMRYKVDGGRPRKALARSCSLTSLHLGNIWANKNNNNNYNNNNRDESNREAIEGAQQTGKCELRPENTILAKSVGCINAKQHFMHRRDRLLISKSWMKAQKTGAEYIGAKIFHRLLTAQPEIKTIFGLEHIPHEMLKYDLRFRQHSLVYTKTIDYVVKNLEFPHYLEQHFELLGRRHVQYQGRGFDPSWWDSFAECMTEAAAEWELHRNRPATSAWRILVSNIIMFMRRGFDDEIGRMKEKVVCPNSSHQGTTSHK